MKLFRLWKVRKERLIGRHMNITLYDEETFLTKRGMNKYSNEQLDFGWVCYHESKRVGLIQWLKGEW